MSPKIGPTSPDPSNHPQGSKPEKLRPSDKKAFTLGPSKTPTTTFMGMQVTQAQKQKIYANLCNMILSEMKRNAARQKRAAEALKKSIEGTN